MYSNVNSNMYFDPIVSDPTVTDPMVDVGVSHGWGPMGGSEVVLPDGRVVNLDDPTVNYVKLP